MSITILVFTLDLSQEKLMTIFSKKSKKAIWDHGTILAFFVHVWAKMNFPGKKALSVFKYSNYLPSCPKSEKTNMIFLRKMLQWIDRRKDGQTTVIMQNPLQAEGLIIKVTSSFPEFLSKYQKPVHSINFFVRYRYSQFQTSATRVSTLIYDHTHPNIFQ